MTSVGEQTKCRSRSKYGRCGRLNKHNGPHAVPIGDSVWYGYVNGRTPLGYGQLDGDTFMPATDPKGQ